MSIALSNDQHSSLRATEASFSQLPRVIEAVSSWKDQAELFKGIYHKIGLIHLF